MTLKGCDMEPKACAFRVKARVYRAKANALGVIASHIRPIVDYFIAKCHISFKIDFILSIF